MDKAQYNLAKAYRDGDGAKQDDILSVKWFRRAAEQGYAKAQSHLATRYVRGQGIESDLVEAFKWATLAARQGHQRAQENVIALINRLTPEQRVDAKQRISKFRPKQESR